MKRFFTVIVLLTIVSCKTKKIETNKKRTIKTAKVNTPIKTSKQAERIIDYAKTFDGTRYKYGGIDKRGMDCSGLIQTSFKKYDVLLPRTTADLKNTGSWVDLKNIAVGDLVFFATKKNSRTINHVGIITNAKQGNIEFIHASSSKGVMVSSLAERYWYFAYVQARRVL